MAATTENGRATGAKPPVIVIGAGIVGVATAIWLQRDSHDVLLIDRAGPAEGTSYGNGGVLASCSIVPVTVPGLVAKAPRMLLDPGQPLFLRWSYLPKLTPWLLRYLGHCKPEETRRIAAAMAPLVSDSLADHEALSAGTGAEKWVVPADYLFLYRDRAHYEGDAFGWSIRRDHGFVWDELEGPAFHDYDPVFGKEIGFAARLKGHGRIADPGQYVKDLARHFEARGGRFLRAEVNDFAISNGRVTGVVAGGETIACSAAVDRDRRLVEAAGREARPPRSARERAWLSSRTLGAQRHTQGAGDDRLRQVRRNAHGRTPQARRHRRIRRPRRAGIDCAGRSFAQTISAPPSRASPGRKRRRGWATVRRRPIPFR